MPADAVPYGRSTQRSPAVKEVHILWITAGLSCDGDSVSITAAPSPASKTCCSALFPGYRRFTYTTPCLPMKSAMTS